MDETIARYECYRIFSLLFKMPDEDIWIKSDLLSELEGNLQILKLPDNDKLSSMNTELQKIIFEDIKIEYTKLFLGPFEVLVHPYGSCYIEGSKQVMKESSIKVKEFYSKYGIEIEEGFNDLPDHIVPELEFMYYLLYNTVNRQENDEIFVETYHAASKDFFKKYLFRFAIQLSESIIEKTELKMFQEMVTVFIGFINYEADINISSSKNAS